MSGSDTQVTVATMADVTPSLIADVQRLVQDLNSSNQVEIDEAWLSTIVNSDSSQLLLAISKQDAIQGLAILVIYPTLTNPRALVETLVIEPKFRRQGIATALIKKALSLAAARQVSWVRLAASEENQASNQLLQKLGAEMTPNYNEYGFDVRG